jgi:chromosome segregation ATPase
MAALLGLGGYAVAAHLAKKVQDEKSKKEKAPVKKRSPERAVRARNVILTVLGEHIEELETMLDAAMTRIEDGALRETKLTSEVRGLEGQLASARTEHAIVVNDRDQALEEVAHLREVVRSREEEIRAMTNTKGAKGRRRRVSAKIDGPMHGCHP